MAAPTSVAVSADTLITIKITVNEDATKKLKLPVRDLGVNVLPTKLRQILNISAESRVILERYSDSAAGYVPLDEKNVQAFKTLIRAAKAKLKLRLKITVTPYHTPITHQEPRGPTEAAPKDVNTPDQRNIGSGIFDFRDKRASQQTLVNVEDTPAPENYTSIPSILNRTNSQKLAFRPKEPSAAVCPVINAWSVYCNSCDNAMDNHHFHCSICDDGDYDLCEKCVAQGKVCPGEGHWLVKRFIHDGKVVNSTTERVSPKKQSPTATPAFSGPTEESFAEAKRDIPGAFADEIKSLAEESLQQTRTCNSCVIVLAEREFVTCDTCEDFDLCIKCHSDDKHGHHPAHGFKPATEDTVLSAASKAKLAVGRDARHNAICDGCDKHIRGVRHKCLNCPDWDYCHQCIQYAGHRHAGHRFVALYEPIADSKAILSRHIGVMCDGPLCANRPGASYITGVRYKCTICHDTDFCASCEAHPSSQHNPTHPLLKLRTPVRNISVATENEVQGGQVRVLGDRRQQKTQKAGPCEKLSAAQTNCAIPVQTVAEIKPIEAKKDEAVPIPVKPFEQTLRHASSSGSLLNAEFVSDSVADGTIMAPNIRFTQVWILKNPGPAVWPAGCSVRYVGGDNMLNVDNKHPAAVGTIAAASESNILAREIKVGEEVGFMVTLKAPVREGKSISYWRVKAPDGTPFGHRLWCDIDVKQPEPNRALFAHASNPNSAKAANERVVQLAQMRAHMSQQAQAAAQLQAQAQAQAQAQSQAFAMQRAMHQKAMQEHQMKKLTELRNLQQQKMQAMSRTDFLPGSMAPAPLDHHPSMGPAGEASMPRVPYQMSHHALQDYQTQLLLLDQQNKRRLLICRQEADARAEQARAIAEQTPSQQQTDGMTTTDKVSRILDAHAQNMKVQEEQLDRSQMVFPKLEKESPASSTYESVASVNKAKAAYVENEAGEVEQSAAPAVSQTAASVASTDEYQDLEEEIEVLSAVSEESAEEDGFVTDEEYDILDASDQETVA